MNDITLIIHYKASKDEIYLEQLINRHEAMFHQFAKEFQYKIEPLTYEDIYQEAKIALVQAVEDFDEHKNTKFSTYLYIVINHHILKYLRMYNAKKRNGGLMLMFEQNHFSNLTYQDSIGVKPEAHEMASLRELERKFLELIFDKFKLNERLIILGPYFGVSDKKLAQMIEIDMAKIKTKRYYLRKKLKKIAQNKHIIK